MISLEKLKILTPLQKLPKNVGDLGKLIIDKGFEKFPKVQSGHTGQEGKMKLRSIIKQLALNLLTSDYAWKKGSMLETYILLASLRVSICIGDPNKQCN